MRTLYPTLVLAILAAASHSPASSDPSVRMIGIVVNRVPLKVIDINLNDSNVKITGAITKYGAGHSEPFAQIVHRACPTVALTGTFFCPRSLKPIGDIVID